MNSLLFPLVGAVVLMIGAMRNNRNVRKALNKQSGKIGLLPQAISLLAITAQLPELVRVLEQVSLVHVVIALFLLTILVATRSGTESEWP